MRNLIASGLLAMFACLLGGCPADNAQPNTSAGGGSAGSAAVPASRRAEELIRYSELNICLSGSLESSGAANYSREGAMVLGGEEASSVSYEIGRLRNGDQLDKLIMDIAPGRMEGSGCTLKIALAGADSWQEFPLNALDHPQELLL